MQKISRNASIPARAGITEVREMNIRTDLAVEAHELSHGEAEEISGVTVDRSAHGSISRTAVDIVNDDGARALGKAKGRYVTIEAPELKHSLDDYEEVCSMLAKELKAMGCGRGVTLVAGLGNRDITPDAIGSRVVSELIVTHHMHALMPEAMEPGFGSVCAIAPGVMGNTGIETTEIIKSVADSVKPDMIIAVDALAGADINRVCTTIQIADTGIQPGAGVGNNRRGLNESTLGIKVIAVGVPTVIAAELLAGRELDDEFSQLMVTTRDIDLVVKRMSKTIANGINMALHKGLTFRDIESIVS